MMARNVLAICLLLITSVSAGHASADESQLVSRTIRSENIAKNKVGTDPARNLLVYLPAGYRASSPQRYPVIYFLPNPFQAGYRFDFDHHGARQLFDQAIATGIIGKFILVTVDMNTPLGASCMSTRRPPAIGKTS
jgi:hypothetical protein